LEISKPEGGGFLGGGERFQLDTASGSARFEIPLPAPAARGLEPGLALVYRGGAENGLFGLGVALDLPAISRRTALGVPRYDSTDQFVTESGDVLTPRRDLVAGQWRLVRWEETRDGMRFRVTAYRRRIESTFDRIEYWEGLEGPDSFWKLTDQNNVTSVFGDAGQARISDPEAPQRVFRWMIEQRYDAKGNRIAFAYERDDTALHASLYPVSIAFGAFKGEAGAEAMAYRYVFDYGPGGDERPDVVVSFRPGFELRVARRCAAIGLEHYFPAELGPEPVRVQELRLAYTEPWGLSLLHSLTRVGFGDSFDPKAEKASPPVTLGFTRWDPASALFRPLAVDPPRTVPTGSGSGTPRFLDLFGEGVPGILSEGTEPGGAYYWPPEGRGVVGRPAALPQSPVTALEQPPRRALLDLSGLGHLDAVTLEAGQAGYFGNKGDGSWAPFQPLPAAPLDGGSASGIFVDLRGSGLPDFLDEGPSDWRANDCLGADGFAPARPIVPPDGAATYGEAGEAALIQFANIFGDGLSHLVRVSSGYVRIWPNLGGTRFGPPRDVPIEIFPESSTAKDILLAELTGAGGVALCVFGEREVAIYQNHYGLRFTRVATVPLPVDNSLLTSAAAADLDGIGVSRIVVGAGGPNEGQWTLDPAGGAAPFLLNRIDNGMGRETELAYRSSTAFYFAARAAGNPWLTRSPFPVNVVERMTQRDAISGATLVRFLEYRDGYFDPIDRQFAGFAYVQVRDHSALDPRAWLFAPPAELATETVEPGVEPLFTRTWSLVGDMANAMGLRAAMLEQAYLGGPAPLILPPPAFDPAIDAAEPETRRLAWRALANRTVRSEAFPVTEDGSAAAVPFAVDQSAYAVRLIQPSVDGQPAVVLALERETARISYEREPDDAQTSHVLKLAIDPYGQSVRDLTIGYARLARSGRDVLPAQAATALRLATRGVINHVDGGYRNASGGTAKPVSEADAATDHVIGLPFAEQSFELAGFPAPSPHYRYDQATAITDACMADVVAFGEPFTGGAQARVFAWSKSIYWNAGMTAPAPEQRTGPQTLGHHNAKAVFSAEFVARFYRGKVDAAMLASQGGYAADQGYWWWPGDTLHYAGAARYFVPAVSVDPFGNRVETEHDRYDLFVVRRTDAKGDEVTASYDYRALSPTRVVDENHVATEYSYDPLAEVVLRGIYGTEDGVVVGDEPLSDYVQVPAPTAEAVLADPAKYLQGAGRYFLYDLEAWSRSPPLPPFTLELERLQFARPGPGAEAAPSDIAITLRYFDGAGRDLAAAELVSGQPPYTLFDDTRPRSSTRHSLLGDGAAEWRIANQVRYDDRGDVVTRYQPYFADAPAFEDRPDAACWAMRCDGLHREIETETPKGFLTRNAYAAWSTTHWDEDDLVLESPYYAGHIDDPGTPAAEKEALRQAAAFADTPETSVRDVLGRAVQTVRYLVEASEGGGAVEPRRVLKTYAWYDAQDKESAFADARFYNEADPNDPTYFNYFVLYDMLGHGVWQKSADSGNVPLRAPEDGIPRLRLFDGAGLPLVEWSRRGYRLDTFYSALRQPSEVRATGPALAGEIVAQRFVYGDDADANCVNRVVETMDQAGIVRTPSYTITGDATAFSRQFTADATVPTDWRDPAAVPLQAKVWTWSKKWNAVSEEVGRTAPNGAFVATGYTLNGWPRIVRLGTGAGQVLEDVAVIGAFAPDGRPRTLTLPAAADVTSDYDPATLRLARTAALSAKGDSILDLAYTYDPTGNVTQIDDATPVGGGAPDARLYVYDSLYRLRRATGRRQAQPGTGVPEDYAQAYSFDDATNLTALVDEAGGSYSTLYAVSASSDHAVTDAMAADRPPDDYYDADGLLTQLPDGSALAYDAVGRLARLQAVQASALYQYGADGARTRKLLTPADGETGETDYLDGFIAVGGADGRGELLLSLGEQLVAVVRCPSVSAATGAEPRLQLSDRIQSVTYELAADGAILNGQSYYPFGETAIYVAPSADPRADKRYQFVGRELDPESGLYHFTARPYSPVLARWIVPDPAGTVDGPNLFAYVLGNPVSRVDPTGENGKDGDKPKSWFDALFKGASYVNKASVFVNALGETMGVGIHHPIADLHSNYMQVAAAQSVALGGFAAFGGAFGAAYYARDMQKKGVNPYNSSSFVGNLFFTAEGVMIYRTLFVVSEHALHAAHMKIGRVGFIADVLKIPKAIKDKDYGSAGLYTSLALGNLQSSMTPSQATSAYKSIFQGGASVYNRFRPQSYATITSEMVLNGATRAARVPGPYIFMPYVAAYLATKYYNHKNP
jgi:RHS repeat-associated protein